MKSCYQRTISAQYYSFTNARSKDGQMALYSKKTQKLPLFLLLPFIVWKSTVQAIKQSSNTRNICGRLRPPFSRRQQAPSGHYDILFVLYFASDNNHPVVSMERQILRRAAIKCWVLVVTS